MVDRIDLLILPAGEGKTRWLVGRAFEEAGHGNNVVFLSRSAAEYDKFLTYYRSEYGAGCPVRHVDDMVDIPYGSVVLIDDYHKKEKKTLFNLDALKEKCQKIIATMEGKRK